MCIGPSADTNTQAVRWEADEIGQLIRLDHVITLRTNNEFVTRSATRLPPWGFFDR